MKISSRVVKYLVLSGLALFLGGQVSRVNAQSWYNTAWAYRNAVTITNSSGGTLTDFQVHVTLDASFNFSKAQSTGADLRVTNSNGTTLLSFWIESWSQAGSSASIWVKIPSIPSAGGTIYLYYGNPTATSTSSGSATFDFFDDFEGTPTAASSYWTLGSAATAFVQNSGWETSPPHSLSVVVPPTASNGGFTYWGYYGLFDTCAGVGLARTNDSTLNSWTKYVSNPIFGVVSGVGNARWPSVVAVTSPSLMYYMVYEKNYCAGTGSIIELATSPDGITFTDSKVIVPANYGSSLYNQNPSLYLNPKDGLYYLYYYSGGYEIHARSAALPSGLDTATDVTVLTSPATLAAPNMYYNSTTQTYFLSTETYTSSGVWNVDVFASTSPTSGFKLLPGNPIMSDNSACMNQWVFPASTTTLHVWYCNLDATNGWTVQHRTATLTTTGTAGRASVNTPNSSLWTLPTRTGDDGGVRGAWTIASNVTQQDGTSGKVALGVATDRQILLSTFSGGDYVLEAYGKQLDGVVWGLGVRASDWENYYSLNLNENLDSSPNLFLYSWVNNGGPYATATLGQASVGTVNLNTWYKLTAKVHSSEIDVYKDGVSEITGTDSSLASGSVALYGEANTFAEYNNVLVRKYASADPTTSVGSTPSLVLSSMTFNPTSVVGTNSSTGTVTLAAAAPSGGLTVTLSSNSPTVASVPASVSFNSGQTSRTFTVTTFAVSTTTQVTITASYNGASLPATLTVTPAVASLSLNPTSVVGGISSQGTVTLGAPAPTGGAVVTLSSNTPAAATVPANVTVAATQTTATFTVTTFSVASNTGVTISATYNGSTQTAGLTVTPAVLSSVSVTTPVVGGSQSTGTVTLNGPAPTGGAVVTLTSNIPAVATVPASVTVAATQTTATFTVTTNPVATNTPVTISGTYNSTTLNTTLTVTPPGVGSVSMNPTSVTGGTSSTGTVTLSGPAPAGGAVVTLSSNNTAAAQVPATVAFAAGATTGTFAATTSPVAGSTPVTITATYNSTSGTAILTVTPPVVSSVGLNPTSVTGGSTSTGTVTLSAAAPTGGAVVTLSSDNAAAASVPASVAVAAAATTATFTVTSHPVASSTQVNISATYNSTTQSGALTVTPPVVSSVSVIPTSVTGGSPSTGTVTLSGPAPTGGAVVTLSSNTTAAATVPVSVTVAAAATTATFTVTTIPVASSTPVTISATYNSTTQSATLTVLPPGVGSVAFTPPSVTGGTSTSGKVTLSAAAPSGGAVVTLSSNNITAATVPASVTVAENTTFATFTVTTNPVATNTLVTISATYNSATVTADLTVTPPVVSSVGMSPTSVTGGTSSAGTVTLSGAAPAGGAVVTLASDNTAAATVPASVPVAAGETTGTFTVTTSPVASSTLVNISATYNSTTKSGALTVTPPVVSSLGVNPTSVTGGTPSTGTVTLSGPAPSGGAVVALSSNNTAAATVPATVTVAAAATTATFTVTTSAVATNALVTLSATYNSSTQTASLTVVPPVLSSVGVNPTAVAGGTTSTGTVTLSGPAPSGGALVTLVSSNTPVATVPANVTVAATTRQPRSR